MAVSSRMQARLKGPATAGQRSSVTEGSSLNWSRYCWANRDKCRKPHRIVRIRERADAVECAYAKFAPRYTGDEEFDVRTLGTKYNWYPELPERSKLKI
jgi:hypothetical protein